MLYPRTKQETLGARHAFVTPCTVFCADAPSARALFALGEMLPQIEYTEVDAPSRASLTLSVVPGLFSVDEAYELSVKDGAVLVRARDYRGLIYAISTLSQLLCADGDTLTVPDAQILDYPDTAFRAFMVDPARSLIPMEEMYAQILSMAKAKLNKLHIHLSDSRGFAYLSSLPVPMAPKGQYSKEELAKIIRYADAFGIDVIPEIDVPAHATALGEMHPDLKCKVEGEEVSGWNLCLGNEDCYRLIDALLAEIAEIFPYEYIHVGTDELDMRDLIGVLQPSPISHSESCECCRAFFSPLGLHTLTDRFYWFVNRIYKTVTSLGKKMMMWNDSIDISKAPPIPRDILIEFWRVAAEQRGPVEGCSMQRFLEEGFEVVNADFPNTYVDEYVNWEQLKKWNARLDPADATARPSQVIGGEMCAWEGTNYPHYLYALYFAIPAFGDRLWNLAPIPEGKDATVALTRAALGMDTPDGFDVTGYMKEVPLGTSRFWEDGAFSPDANLEEAKAILEGLHRQSLDEKKLTEELLRQLAK